MRHLLITLLSLLVAVVASAQTAKQILDKTAQTLEQSQTAQADFRLTTFAGVTEQGVTSGTIVMRGKMFHLTTPEMQTWYDGHTQWTILSANGQSSNEVNVQEPTEAEQARMNPYAFIALYKKGYRLSKVLAPLRGKETYEVTLQAKSPSTDLQTIVVNIDKDNYQPLCIRLKHGDDWVRIAIHNLVLGKQHSDSEFTFPADKYPNIQVIDLR